ncbi:PEP-CTERM sorting domain-containing protein [Rubellicoccus peritrichatus]|uniref:PEP-CTERM sorting domain-containing protein n=1 Tax=Rubellicoccus peritrichatus TaxID=3080537 RepID=A0AAQ3LC14_9BACT|nr:PEP-CTERM sorting domain-containing protein [Puniceicoccus sp. CR14]WOO39379.1 PEP-CTERM sorting domain-containing protein [Puniceicoccus sp. CR14]
MISRLLPRLTVAALALVSFEASAISIGFSNDFSTDVEGWQHGNVTSDSPTRIATGGPGGGSDPFMQFASGTGVARLAAFNTDSGWTGDYTTAGVTGISLDVNNTGATALDLRFAITGPGGGWVSTNSVSLGAGSGWTSILIPIDAGSLTATGAAGATAAGTNVGQTLGGVTQLRLISSAGGANFRGDAITATLGVDNVTAVPEPGTYAMILGALGLGFAAYRRRSNA